MKSILISVRPEHAVNILNGSKTLELRKSVPKDFVGWVYMYVTKNGDTLHFICMDNYLTLSKPSKKIYRNPILNGFIVARFWFDGYEYYNPLYFENTGIKELNYLVETNDRILLCLEDKDITNYGNGKDLYAWHISKLEIFDKPIELSEFYRFGSQEHHDFIMSSAMIEENERKYFIKSYELQRPPQSWQYVWVKE